MIRFSITAICFGLLAAAAGFAQENEGAAEDPSHEELRELRRNLVEALNANNIDRVLSLCHENIVMTAQNAEVARGRDGVRAYNSKMTEGPDRRVNSFTTDPTVDELSILHGDDTAIAFGSSKDHYVLPKGQNFVVNSRWTAVAVKEGDQWLIASLHVSANLFDNPLLKMALKSLYWGTAIAGVMGLLIGAAVTFFVMRKKRRESSPPATLGWEKIPDHDEAARAGDRAAADRIR
jgi:ketosteroid isomerase-like protein